MFRPNTLLLTAVFGPYGVKDKYAEALGCQMELLNNQITRCQGIHSPRQAYWSFGLYLIAENLDTSTTVLDFPKWEDFTRELKKGYTHVGISFIVPNVLKARRMALHIREKHPEIKIILGGYGTVIPDLDTFVPHDAVCHGEGARWLRAYFGEDVNAPLRHPALIGPAYERIYGFSSKPRGAILMPGLGCENGCSFCITSHKFNKRYVPLLDSGARIFEACRKTESAVKATGFSVMDENFLKRPERARALLSLMEQHGKPYVFDLFSSAETIRELGADFLLRLGVRMVWIGVESKNSPHAKNQGIDLKALVNELQDKGVIVQASMILFQEHHNEQNIHEDIAWAISLGSSLTQFMNYTPFPGTMLHEQLEREGRLKQIPYRRLHGQDELAFAHPNFPRPADHVRILREAFRQKYLKDGPGVVNMALTLARGVQRGWEDLRARERNGLAWNPATMRYEKGAAPQPDRFMKRRLLMMARMATGLRPALWAAWVYAPNSAARRKARETMRLYVDVLGKPTTADRLKALGLVVTGGIELVRLRWNQLLGRESIVYQPSCRRTEYRKDAPAQAATLLETLASSLETLPDPCHDTAGK
ncbi:MAG TPA: radical SAM protein [Candidatus Hydrogenedentes bacterium]|nr:radical SAM protein [Candidatus Hydrogenedentota bacterium]